MLLTNARDKWVWTSAQCEGKEPWSLARREERQMFASSLDGFDVLSEIAVLNEGDVSVATRLSV